MELVTFSAIELSDYQILDWQIRETIGLSNIGSRPQSIGLSDIEFTKNNGLPTIGITNNCSTPATADTPATAGSQKQQGANNGKEANNGRESNNSRDCHEHWKHQ
jgi:hypothetical protein